MIRKLLEVNGKGPRPLCMYTLTKFVVIQMWMALEVSSRYQEMIVPPLVSVCDFFPEQLPRNDKSMKIVANSSCT